jgi:hypothetical protein
VFVMRRGAALGELFVREARPIEQGIVSVQRTPRFEAF